MAGLELRLADYDEGEEFDSAPMSTSMALIDKRDQVLINVTVKGWHNDDKLDSIIDAIKEALG